MKFKFIFLILFLFVYLAPNKSDAKWAIMKQDADSLVQLGADYIYNVKFDSARICFDKVIKMYPNHPAGYFLQSMVGWWQMMLWGYGNKYEKEFLRDINNVIKICDEILIKDEFDLTALFFKGGALGYRGRYYAQKQMWIDAASDGSEAFSIMRKCHEKAPGNHDIMLGTGIYNYFAKAIPDKYPLAAPLLAIFPKGDKSLGILQLKASAYHARYSAIEAHVTLMQIFYNFENNVTEAEFWVRKLTEKYPDNPYFQRYLGKILVKKGNWVEIEEEWRNILKRALNRDDGFNNITAREGCYYVGISLDRKNDIETAKKYYKKCIEISNYLKEPEHGFAISAKLKLAMLEDKSGNRNEAVKHYKELLKMNDYDKSHEKSNKYLSFPYK